MMNSLDIRYCEPRGVEIINKLLKLGLNIEAEAFSTSKHNDAVFTHGTRLVNFAHTFFELALTEALDIEALKQKQNC